MNEIVAGLTKDLKTPEEVTNITKWAQANPMLADRLYNKRFPGGVGQQSLGQQAQNVNVPVTAAFNRAPLTQGAQFPQTDVSGAFGNSNLLGGVNPYTMPSLAGGSAPHGMDTNTLYGREAPNFGAFNLPGGAMTQGMNVSNQFSEAANKAAAFTNPQNFESQGAEGVAERASKFLDMQRMFGNVR
jgi:hypothetical protein